jgi:hypothetical protein
MASCAHVPHPTSKCQACDLHRPMPGSQARMTCAPYHGTMRASGGRPPGRAGRGCHTPAWAGSARFQPPLCAFLLCRSCVSQVRAVRSDSDATVVGAFLALHALRAVWWAARRVLDRRQRPSHARMPVTGGSEHNAPVAFSSKADCQTPGPRARTGIYWLGSSHQGESG